MAITEVMYGGRDELTMTQYEALTTIENNVDYDITDYPSTSITNAQMTYALTTKRLFPAGATFICSDNGTYTRGHAYMIAVSGSTKSWLDISIVGEILTRADVVEMLTNGGLDPIVNSLRSNSYVNVGSGNVLISSDGKLSLASSLEAQNLVIHSGGVSTLRIAVPTAADTMKITNLGDSANGSGAIMYYYDDSSSTVENGNQEYSIAYTSASSGHFKLVSPFPSNRYKISFASNSNCYVILSNVRFFDLYFMGRTSNTMIWIGCNSDINIEDSKGVTKIGML